MKLSTLETCVRIESRAHTPIRKVLAFALALGPTALIGCATPPREPVRAPVAEVAKPIATEAMASRRVEPAGAPVALPAEVRDMALSFVAADGDPAAAQISRTMRAALVREGYWLAEPGSRTPDGRLEVHVSRAPSADADAEGSELKVDLVLVRDQSTVESLVTSIDPSVPASMPKRIDEIGRAHV